MRLSWIAGAALAGASPAVAQDPLAPLPALLPLVARHLAPVGTALLLKGRGWAAEVEAARAAWSFDLQAVPSATDPQARVLVLSGLARA